MAKPFPWSYSRLKDFEKCPKMFQGKHVTKEFPQPDFDAPHLKRGKLIHAALEQFLISGNYDLLDPTKNIALQIDGESVLKTPLEFLKPILEKLLVSDGLVVEQQLAFDINHKPDNWFSNATTWYRIIMDVKAFSSPTQLVILDWKSGKVFGEVDQLKMSAGVGFKQHPKVEEILVAYIFVDHPDAPPKYQLFKRKEMDQIWQEFGDRSDCINLARESGSWEPKPSAFNCKWCPAMSNQCEFKQRYS